MVGVAFLMTSCNKEIKQAKEYYSAGVECLEEGRYPEAEEHLAKAVHANAEKAEYFIAYGMSLAKTGKYAEAQEQFDKAILEKNNQIVRENNKQAYRGKGIAYYEEANYEEAILYFQKALEISDLAELNTDITYYKADAEEKNGNYEEAKNTLTSLLESGKENVTTYLKRAHILCLMEEYDLAKKDYEQAHQLEKNNYQAYLEEYFMFLKQGDEDAAKAVLEQTNHLKVSTKEEAFYQAVVQYYKGEEEGAVEQLSAMAAEGYTRAYYYLGQIYASKEDDTNAISNYKKYIELENGIHTTEVYNELALCYSNTKAYEEAIETLRQGISLKDGKTIQQLKKNLIAVYEKALQFEEAYEAAREYIKIYPKDKKVKKEYKFLRSRVEKKITATQNGKTATPEETEGKNSPTPKVATTETPAEGAAKMDSPTDSSVRKSVMEENLTIEE